MGAAPVRPATARSSALASSRPACSSPSGTRPATVVGTPRPSTANMRMNAALAVTMRPSASAVAMPKGADWKTRVSRISVWACASARVGSSLRSSTSTEMMPLRPVAAADQLGGEGAAILAQQIELEPRRAALGAARHGADQVGAVGRHDVEQRQRAAGLGAQAQPLRQRRVDMRDAPVGSHGEQALRKTVVEGQRRLQPAHRLDLARALAGDVGHLPQRQPLSLQAGARGA